VRAVRSVSVFVRAAFALAAGALAVGACARPSLTPDEIELALSAAPAAVAGSAAVVRMDDHGVITRLRSGSNGWTCMATDPGTPISYPVCVDQAGLQWFEAVMAGRPPDPASVGYSYMLAGGSVWSATDPAAASLPAGETKPIMVPPHIMVMNAKLAADSGFPSGEAHPDTGKPFVLYGGTPWAILIIPVR
jgi:hypothetical protein